MHDDHPSSRAWAWRARPVRRAWFASDLHLHGGDPGGVQRACRLVQLAREDGADALFLLGDVFRAWLGPRSLEDAGLLPFLHALRDATAAGVRVAMVHGNHDYLLGAHVEAALGVEVSASGLNVALGGLRARLVHGDEFCTRDADYQRLHRVLRSAPARALAQALPARVERAIADVLLGSSRHATAAKTGAVMAIVDDAVRRQLATGLDVIVCGHVHTARDAMLEVEGRRARLVVMADFERSGSHARWADGRLVLSVRDARFAAPGFAARPVIVAIDGPAGSGKSSVSRALAARLGFRHLDSGAFYRAVTARALAAGIPAGDPRLGPLARSLDLSLDAEGRVRIGDEVVPETLLRGASVSAHVSAVSADPGVRAALLPVQRRQAEGVPGLVAEGRDMGSVVFPEADFRFYLDAAPQVRAQRRLAQSGAEGADAAEVAAQLQDRDRRDSTRPHAPLAVAEGATVLDTSALSLQEVVERLRAAVAAGAFAAP